MKSINLSSYKNKRVLITGHTGFKGSWLFAWLTKLGANVRGLSLPLEGEGQFCKMFSAKSDFYGDIRNLDFVKSSIREFSPHIVFHLAAQSVVAESYQNPYGCFSTNFQGTLNVFEACRKVPSVKGIVYVSTDKVYLQNGGKPFKESDALGGTDPYSTSKVTGEMLLYSYQKNFFEPGHVISCRSGNVIGGADWASHRLFPDIIKALFLQKPLVIRQPLSVRPWLHVLDTLHGYLLVGQELLNGNQSLNSAYNFSPDMQDHLNVTDVMSIVRSFYPDFKTVIQKAEFEERERLILDSSQARKDLNWRPALRIVESIKMTLEWYDKFYNRNKISTYEDIEKFEKYLME